MTREFEIIDRVVGVADEKRAKHGDRSSRLEDGSTFICLSKEGRIVMTILRPNMRCSGRRERRGCNPYVPCAGDAELGRSAASHVMSIPAKRWLLWSGAVLAGQL